METPKFNRLAERLVGQNASTLNFIHYKRLCFVRPRNQWNDVFFLDLLRPTKDAFKVVVGIHVPARAKRMEILNHDNIPWPEVSSSLGILDRKQETWYEFTDADSLKDAIDRMWLDFKTQAEPWLNNFNTIRDVANDYFEGHIAENLLEGMKRWPSPMSWAIYGYLLIEAGDMSAGRKWLTKARRELDKPRFMKGGQIYFEKVPGSQEIPLSDDRRGLMQILNKENL